MIIYNSRHIIKRPAWRTYKRWLTDIAVFVGLVFLTGFIPMNTSTFISIILWCIPVTLGVLGVYILTAFVTEPSTTKDMIGMAKGIFLKKKKTESDSVK